MTNKAYAVPLHELLVGVPRDTRLEITDPDGMGTRFIPVGRYCHEAAEALRARLAQPEQPDYSKAGFGKPELKQRTGNCLLTGVCAAEGHRIQKAQREWQGLTDEEIKTLWDDHIIPVFNKNGISPFVFARAIEAKLKERNA